MSEEDDFLVDGENSEAGLGRPVLSIYCGVCGGQAVVLDFEDEADAEETALEMELNGQDCASCGAFGGPFGVGGGFA